MTSDILPSVVTSLSIVAAVATVGVLAPLMVRDEPRIRPANDNRPFDATTLTLMAFGPSLLVALVVTALWLWATWS